MSRRCPCLLPRRLVFFPYAHTRLHTLLPESLPTPDAATVATALTISTPLPPPVFSHSHQSPIPASCSHHHAMVPSSLPLSVLCEFCSCVAQPYLVLIVGLVRDCEPIWCSRGYVRFHVVSSPAIPLCTSGARIFVQVTWEWHFCAIWP